MIQTQDKVRSTVKQNVGEVVGYTIDPNDFSHIEAVMRDLYSDPEMAIVREYTANAIDAHTLAGIQRPVEITAPTEDDPILYIRDFGPGLGEEDTKRLLFGYGASGDEKRVSNDFIGSFGAGAKCGFSILDSFTYIIRHNGVKTVWACFKDDDDRGCAAKMSEEPCNEPSGIEVQLPLPESSVAAVRKRLQHAFVYFNGTTPKITRLDNDLMKTPAASVEGAMTVVINGEPKQVLWRLITKQAYDESNIWSDPLILMGGIPYPVDMEQLAGLIEDLDSGNTQMLKRLHITLPIGTIPLSPSRESLKYSGRTKKILGLLMQEFVKPSFMDKMCKDLMSNGSGTFRDRVISIQQALGFSPDPKRVGETHSWASLAGLRVPKKFIDGAPAVFSAIGKDGYSWAIRHKNDVIAMSSTTVTPLSEQVGPVLKVAAPKAQNATVIIPYDPGAVSESFSVTDALGRRAMALLHASRPDEYPRWAKEYGYCYAHDTGEASFRAYFVPMKPETRAAFEKACPWLQDGSAVMLDFDDVRSTTADPALMVQATTMHGSSSRSSGPESYEQHGRKLCALKPSPAVRKTYGRQADSIEWEPLMASETKDGIYVVMDRFLVQQPDLRSDIGFAEIRNIMNSSSFQQVIGGNVRLIGVRPRDVESLQKNGSFTCLWDKIREIFQQALVDGDLTKRQIITAMELGMSEEHVTVRGDVMSAGQGIVDLFDELHARRTVFRKERPDLVERIGLVHDGLHPRTEWGRTLAEFARMLARNQVRLAPRPGSGMRYDHILGLPKGTLDDHARFVTYGIPERDGHDWMPGGLWNSLQVLIEECPACMLAVHGTRAGLFGRYVIPCSANDYVCRIAKDRDEDRDGAKGWTSGLVYDNIASWLKTTQKETENE